MIEIGESELVESFNQLSLENKKKFELEQKKIQENLIINLLKNDVVDAEILDYEKEVLDKLKLAYQNSQKNDSGEFKFLFSSETDKKIYVNLVRKLTIASFQKGPEIMNKKIDRIKNTENPELENFDEQDFKTFNLKRGETDNGVYWYQYINKAWKKLKEKGKVEWGKERIYFDVPFDQFVNLRDLIFEISSQEKIAVAFKHLDEKKTTKINLDAKSETTRFVVNFASTKEAKKFFQELQKNEMYQKLTPDRQVDYHGFKLDNLAHYASGYRERRSALENIIKSAKKNSNGDYVYMSSDGSREITISLDQYKDFVEQYNRMPDPKKQWNEENNN